MAGPSRKSRIPASRLERVARIGWLAGEAALGGAAEKLRRRLPSAAEASVEASALLTGGNARRLAARLSRLRGAAMKLGQLLSMEGEDLLPAEFTEALAILRAEADAMPEKQLHETLARALGPAWRTRFREFDPEPIAAASIGQVHAATAADGRELAVKVQYPGVARSIESDVDNLATALRFARLLPAELEVGDLVEEAKRQLRQEADYRAEAEHLARYGEHLAGDADFVVPTVHPDLSAGRVLAMQRLRGVPVEDLAGPEHPQPRRDRAAAALFRLLFREIFELRFLQSDPNPANFLWLPETAQIGLLDLGAAFEVPEALADAYARLFAAGIANDRAALRAAALEIGFLSHDERPDRIEGLVDIMQIGCEPFRQRGPYDFASSDLTARARDAGMELAFRRGFWKTPPTDTLYLHRKLGGVFLLCARLRARADVNALIEPFLAERLAA